MNARNLLPPLAAVILVAAWAWLQQGSIRSYKEDISALKETIGSARASLASASTPAAELRPGSAAKTDGPIDWMSVLKQSEEPEQGVGNMRAILRLQQRISSWSADEIVAALAEIRALDIGEEQRLRLEQMLIGPLGEKDPALAMELFAGQIGDMGAWVLAATMDSWLTSDPTAAMAWFDQAVADGRFDSKALDGRSQSRLQFENTVISRLLKSNPAAAADRVATLPQRDRMELLGRLANNLQEPGQYISLVRSSLKNEQEVTQALTSAATTLAQRDSYQKASEFLTQAALTPEAYAKAIESTAVQRIQNFSWQRSITTTDIDEMRAWASAESPGSQDRLTGEALANVVGHGNRTTFEDAVEMVSRYQQTGGNDDVLYAFIDKAAHTQHRGKAQALIENISDPEQRQQLLEKYK